MHAILVFLVAAALMGARAASRDRAVPRLLIVVFAVVATLALTSRRIVI